MHICFIGSTTQREQHQILFSLRLPTYQLVSGVFFLSWFDLSSVHSSHMELLVHPRYQKATSVKWPDYQLGQTEVIERNWIEFRWRKFWIQRKIRRCASCLPGHQLTSRTHILFPDIAIAIAGLAMLPLPKCLPPILVLYPFLQSAISISIAPSAPLEDLALVVGGGEGREVEVVPPL